MMKFIKNNLVSLIIFLILFVGVGTIFAAVITPNFPTTANNFVEGDVIEEEDWNAIENTIGITSTTSTATLHGKWNDLFASTTLPQITTLTGLITTGTITTGTWNSTIATTTYVDVGGTGITSYTIGDLLYADTTGTLTKLGIGSEGQVIKVSSGLPVWGTDIGGIVENIFQLTSALLIEATTTTSDFELKLGFFTATSTTATSTFAGGFDVNNGGLIYDRSTGFVGIGTASPLFELDVRGSGTFLASFGTTNTFEIAPDFVGAGEINAGAFMQTGGGDMVFAADPTVGASTMIAYKEGGTWRSALEIAHTASGFGNLLLMKSGGNVGIGDTTPTYKLTVNGNAQFASFVDAEYFVATSTTATSTFPVIAWTTATSTASDLTLANITGSTFSTVQDLQNIFHSAGWVSGGGITDDADGTITVAAGTGLIRATDGSTVEILFFDWAQEAGANVNIADNDISYVYAEYNAGSPRAVAVTTLRTDFNTNVLLAIVARSGTTLHINTEDRPTIGNHASNMIRRLKDTMPFNCFSGGIISETGTRNVALTSANCWQGLTEFTTSAFDSSGANSFTYFFRDGVGGFNSQSDNSTIDNLAYDNNSGATTTLSNNKYGVFWVYLEVDDDVDVLYGLGDYTLTQAQDAQPPSAVPDQINTHGFLVGKIIVKQDNATFTQIESAFETTFTGSLATDHGLLAGLADIADHAYALLIDGTRALTGNWDAGSFGITATKFLGDPGTVSAVTFGFASDPGTGIYNETAPSGIIQFANGSKERMRLDNQGNLGIGTTSPYVRLSVVGDIVMQSFFATSTIATSTIAHGLNVLAINQTGASATSTFANGIELSGGCFVDIGGVCISGGGAPDQNLWLTIAGDTGSTAANITTDTLTIAGGTNITTAMSGDTLTVNVDNAFLLNDGDIGTGVYDFGGATSFEIVNGTSPTFSAIGQIGLDTTDNQLLIATSTSNNPAVIRTNERIFGFNMGSTTQEWLNGFTPLPPEKDGYVITSISCFVTTGTSVVMTITNAASTADVDPITCATTITKDTAITANSSVAADAIMRVERGTVTGAVDYVTFSIFGTWIRE